MPSSKAIKTLGLRSWPFSVVPDAEAELVWAGRPALGALLQRLLSRLSAHDASSLHLLWADFGAGKTHTLLYLRQIAKNNPDLRIVPVCTVLPKAPKSFVDVYRAVLQSLGVELVVSAYLSAKRDRESRDRVGALLSHGPTGITQALETLAIGAGPLRDAATKWLMADPSIVPRELAIGSLPGKIRTTDEAVQVLSIMTNLVTIGAGQRLLVMIDEFQRIGKLRGASLAEINAGLHTWFNACPKGLSIILSFSFGDASNVRHYLNAELQSRADRRMLSLPPLGTDGALEFLSDLLALHLASGAERRFGGDALSAIVDYVDTRGKITPRRIIQAAGEVFTEGALDLQDGIIDCIDACYARRTLEGFPFDSEEEQ